MRQAVPIHYNNLDRRCDRRAYMEEMLAGLGLEATRHPSFEEATVSDAALAAAIDGDTPLIFSSRESQCNALSHLAMHRRLIESGARAALMLEDDVELSPEILPFLASLDWLPDGIGLVQFERYGSGRSPRLVGPSMPGSPVAGRSLHRLRSRTGGSACYLITREAALLIAARAGLLRTPIDHLLFSPNASPLFEDLGVAIVLPALARQNTDLLASDMSRARADRRKTWRDRLHRAWMDANRTHRHLIDMATGARWRPFEYRAHTAPPPE
jgi:GR25 family glycosyltransferase involved in LPS biosynthesis